MYNKPVLFLIFNRKEETLKVFEVIKKIKPKKLYIASDGYRLDRSDEKYIVEELRKIISDGINWNCELKTLFREKNLGCRTAVEDAINWFFDNEESGIILEDDCLPSLSFFRFCDELLDYYKEDERIMCISGDNFQRGIMRGKYTYYYSQLPHIWGWATWKRAWKLNKKTIENYNELCREKVFNNLSLKKSINQMWFKNINETFKGNIIAWDYIWTLTNFINSGLTIIPNKNLVKNIGFGKNATHTLNKINKLIVEQEELIFPLTHPISILSDKDADEFTYWHNFDVKPLFFKIISKLLRLLGMK